MTLYGSTLPEPMVSQTMARLTCCGIQHRDPAGPTTMEATTLSKVGQGSNSGFLSPRKDAHALTAKTTKTNDRTALTGMDGIGDLAGGGM